MKLLSKQKKSNLGKILTCRKQYLHHVMTFAESILKLSEKVNSSVLLSSAKKTCCS